jgi:hypothetical protein
LVSSAWLNSAESLINWLLDLTDWACLASSILQLGSTWALKVVDTVQLCRIWYCTCGTS